MRSRVALLIAVIAGSGLVADCVSGQVTSGFVSVGVDFTNSGMNAAEQTAFLAKMQGILNAGGVGNAGSGTTIGVNVVNAAGATGTSATISFDNSTSAGLPFGLSNKACRKATIYPNTFSVFNADPAKKCQAMAETAVHEMGHLLCAVHDCNGNGWKPVASSSNVPIACNGTGVTLMTAGQCVNNTTERGTGVRQISITSRDSMRAAILKLLNNDSKWDLQAPFESSCCAVVEGAGNTDVLLCNNESWYQECGLVTFEYAIESGNQTEWEFGWIGNAGEFVSPLPVSMNPDHLLESPGNSFLNLAIRGRAGSPSAGTILVASTSATLTPAGYARPATAAKSSIVQGPYSTALRVEWPNVTPAFRVLLDTGDWGADNGFVPLAGIQPPVAAERGFTFSDGVGGYVRTRGGDISRSPAFAAVGAASARRRTGRSCDDYVSTGFATPSNASFTIAFWYRPDSIGYGHLFGDGSKETAVPAWHGGAFRCFQGGPAGAGNLALAGIPVPAMTTSAPIHGPAGSGTWVHLAVTYDAATAVVRWYVNGVLDSTTPQGVQGITADGANLRFMGFDTSSAAVAPGHYDDLRLYRTALTSIHPSGPWPAGAVTVVGFEDAIPNHEAVMSADMTVARRGTALATYDGYLVWNAGANSAPSAPATAIVNLHYSTVDPRVFWGREAPPLPVTNGRYSTTGFPLLEVGHFGSTPTAAAVGYPDGLALAGSFVLSATTVGDPYNTGYPWNYGNTPVYLHVPTNLLLGGIRLDTQFVALDATQPGAIGVSNRVAAFFIDRIDGPHAHIEARGVTNDVSFGFFEVWNTGTIPIVGVDIDVNPLGFEWMRSGDVQTGGRLADTTSTRFMSDAFTGFTGSSAVGGRLSLGFSNFSGPTKHFVFDCAMATTVAPAELAGARVTVTYIDGTTALGTLAVVPGQPRLAAVDF